jgi:hypothetical protein
MKKLLFTLALVALACLAGPVQAQDQKAQLAQALRSDGFPLEAEILNRFVDLEMSPEWWAIMVDPGEERDARQSFRIVLSGVVAMADRMGLGDAARLNQDTGRKGNSPPLLGMLDSWKDKIHLKIVMNFAPDATSKKETVDGLNRMGNPISSEAVPRAGKFSLLLTYDPKVTEMKTSMSADASSYTVTVPAYTYWRQGNVDDLFKRGQ